MAVSDFLCACFNWPLCATEGMPTGTEFITEPCASVVCKLGMYFRGKSQVVSLLSFVLIAGDKYTVPTVFLMKILMFPRKNILLALLVLTWMTPFAPGVPFLLDTKLV